MKLRMYWSYATRSLRRGGQRTLLAVFCVAVGVLAIVSWQLVGNMVNGALTSNVRDDNGGDVSVRSDFQPLQQQQIAIFDQLKAQGTISDYTAIFDEDAGTRDASGNLHLYTLVVVDPAHFPVAGSPTFRDPSGGSFASLLSGTNIVVTDQFLKDLGVHKGDTVTVTGNGDGRTASMTIAGVIASAGYFNGSMALMATSTFQAIPSSANLPLTYNAVYANVPGDTDANAATAKKDLEAALPLTTVTTVKDALQQNQQAVQIIRYFLQIVGLLALLIGGVGIINTMQVLLRRRRIEIAMLKTTGYRQSDLYGLFGLEAGLLGLLGGIIGALAGVGVSFLVRVVVENAFVISLPTAIDPTTVLAGVAIGFFTALIFGIMPIVQASQVRPQAVLRELPEGASLRSGVITTLLAVMLAVLFFALALSILQNVAVAVGAVGGTGIFLLLLAGVFTLVVLLIGRLPVLEWFRWWYLLLIAVALAVSGLITFVVPSFGVLFLALSLFGIVIVLLPRQWKIDVKMALRNIGRSRARNVTTLVALFIGVFSIGLVLALGLGVKSQLNTILSTTSTYNSYIAAGINDKAAVDQALASEPGIKPSDYVVNATAQDVPVAVNGVPVAQVLQGAGSASSTSLGKEGALFFLSGVQGYDLTSGAKTGVTIVKGLNNTAIGRNLTAADAGTNNVILPLQAGLAPLNLRLNDTVTIAGLDNKPVTLTVVGFYSAVAFVGNPIYADQSVATTVGGNTLEYVYQLKLDPGKADAILRDIQKKVPGIQAFTLVDLLVVVNTYLNNIIIMLTAIASLAMLAGLIIIANAVALAMLERRRELGILKAVGHTSSDVLGEVLIENGVVGFTGGLLAMLLVTLALSVLGRLVFKTDFGVGAPIVLGLVLATAAVCMVIAGFVAWSATRVRPLEVLRYE
jgi:putative ABC transport system permease protein